MICAMAPRDPSPNGTERDVLGSLPHTRPTRRSAKRAAPKVAAAPQEAAATRPRAPRAPEAAAKPAPAPRRRRPAAAKPPVAPPIPAAGYATPRPDGADRGHHGLVGTAIQAVGELAGLGLTVAAQALKGVVGRLPRP
jgi:hypothetical protein